jgi:hypothetical protein
MFLIKVENLRMFYFIFVYSSSSYALHFLIEKKSSVLANATVPALNVV